MATTKGPIFQSSDDAVGTLTLGTAASAKGVLKLSGDTSGLVTIQPASAAGTWSLTLPTTDGNSGEFLQTNGSGVTSWASATTGTRSYSELFYDNETGTTVTVTTAGTYYAFSASTVTVGTQDTNANAVGAVVGNNITIGTNGAGDYRVTASVSVLGPNNAEMHVAFRINSTVQGKTRAEQEVPATGHTSNLVASGILTLAATDTVDLVFTSGTNGDVLTVYHCNISAERISA